MNAVDESAELGRLLGSPRVQYIFSFLDIALSGAVAAAMAMALYFRIPMTFFTWTAILIATLAASEILRRKSRLFITEHLLCIVYIGSIYFGVQSIGIHQNIALFAVGVGAIAHFIRYRTTIAVFLVFACWILVSFQLPMHQNASPLPFLPYVGFFTALNLLFVSFILLYLLLIPFAPAVTISSSIDRLFGGVVLRSADGARSVLSDPLEV